MSKPSSNTLKQFPIPELVDTRRAAGILGRSAATLKNHGAQGCENCDGVSASRTGDRAGRTEPDGPSNGAGNVVAENISRHILRHSRKWQPR